MIKPLIDQDFVPHTHMGNPLAFILDDKENYQPEFLPPKPCLKPPPPLRPKLKQAVNNHGYRLSAGASLSPQSKIFTMHRT